MMVAALHFMASQKRLTTLLCGQDLKSTKPSLSFFTAGLTHQETITFMSYGFPIGTLPIRYLSLPLMHCKLRISEYSPLLDKIAGNFNAWSARRLSFAGRLVLIKYVIGGVLDHNVHLAKGLYQEDRISCSNFLWSGQIEGPAFTKISWATCCLPKQEGGLGLRRYETWNKTLCIRLIWLLFAE